MHKINLLFAFLIGCVWSLRAGDLVVVVNVEGLSEQALSEMHPYWQQGGLRRLSEEAFQTTVTYPHWLMGGDEGLVTLLTGTTPSEHGVSANCAFNRTSRLVENIFTNNKRTAIGCKNSYTAAAILSPTITDRLRMQQPSARIYAIGQHATTAVVLAGHAANTCCWLDRHAKTDSVCWCSTSYYQEGLPSAADQMNINGRLSEIMCREWTPRMEIATYLHPTADERKHAFVYKPNRQTVLPTNANTAVIELALALQKDQRLGANTTQDMLLLELTALTPKAQQAAIGTAEQEDLYIRLNQDLGYLMEQLERRIGRDHLKVMVVGTPRLGSNTAEMAAWNMPIQEFSVDRAVALTSSYLMALYGHERWVDGGCGHTIYLNRTLIEQKHMSLETMRRQVADFLMEFDGIRYACPTNEAYLNPDMVASLHKRFVGDVVFQLQPNYTLSGSPLLPAPYNLSPVMIWSGSRTPFPSTIHSATEVSNYIL